MEDKTLPPEGLSGALQTFDRSERRAFLRRAVAVGVPVVLATVRGRSVLAQTADAPPSGCASANPSGWRARNPQNTCGPVEDSSSLPAPAPQSPAIDLTPPEDTNPGNGFGKGGSKGKK